MVYVIAEAGINHNGDSDLALALVDAAAAAGADAVKFQARTPEVCTPPDQWHVERDTPWGRMTYIDYRHRVELDDAAWERIDRHARRRGIDWFASCWDEPSVDRIAKFDPPAFKIASACLTDDRLVTYTADLGVPLYASTGMSTVDEIDHAVALLPADRTTLLHTTSAYPCPPDQLNLAAIATLADRFGLPVGYSGHEVGLAPTAAAAALGAVAVERHITLDRAMWGSDQAASVEPVGFARLVRMIRTVEQAAGDGRLGMRECEQAARSKLRRR